MTKTSMFGFVVLLFGFAFCSMLLFVTPVSVSAHFLHCQVNKTRISAANVLGRGFDARTGQRTANTLFRFTYDNGDTWSPPEDPDCVFVIPDQISVGDSWVNSRRNLNKKQSLLQGDAGERVNSYLYDKFEMALSVYQSSFEFDVGIRVGSFDAAFVYEKEVAEYKFYLNDQLNAASYSSDWWSWYIATLHLSNLTLAPSFVNDVLALPATLATREAKEQFFDLFSFWGTDVVRSGEFGCDVHFSTVVARSLVEKMSYEIVMQEMGLMMRFWMFDIAAGQFTNRSEIHVDQTFNTSSISFTNFRGGAPSLASNTTLKAWLESCPYYSGAIKQTLMPISRLILRIRTDSNFLVTFQAAVDAYVAGTLKDYNTPPLRFQTNKAPFNDGSQLSKTPTLPLMSGSNKVGWGVDLVDGTLGIAPLIHFTWDQEQTWSMPFSKQMKDVQSRAKGEERSALNRASPPRVQRKAGDQVAVWDQYEVSTFTESLSANITVVSSTVYDFVQQRATKSNWKTWGGFESGSRTTFDFWEHFYARDEAMAESWLEFSWMKISMPTFPSLALHPQVAAALNALPRQLDNSTYFAYEQFFQSFGVAFVDTARMGALLKGTCWFHKCFETRYSQHWVEEQSGWSIFGIIGEGHGHSEVDQRVTQEFKNWSSIDWHLAGGKIVPTQPNFSGGKGSWRLNEWSQWLDTVDATNMAVVDYTLQPISTLIEFDDPQLATLLNLASDIYMDQAQKRADRKVAALAKQLSPPITPSWCPSSPQTTTVDSILKAEDPSQEMEMIMRLAKEAAEDECPYASFQSPTFCSSFGLKTRKTSRSNQNTTREAAKKLNARVGVTYDPVKGEVLLPAVRYTYDQSKTIWNGTTLVSDQVKITGLGCDLDFFFPRLVNQSYEFKTYQEWAQDVSTVHKNGNIMGGSLASSPHWQEVYNRYFMGSTSMVITQQEAQLMRMQLLLPLPQAQTLHPKLAQALEIASTEQQYWKILEYWGPYLVTGARFGGLAEQDVSVKSCSYCVGVDVHTQSLYDLDTILYPDQYDSRHVNTQYTERRQAKVLDLLGGDPHLALPHQWGQRLLTLNVNPVMTFVEDSLPLSSLLPENSPKRTAFESAIHSYLAQAAIARTASISAALKSFLQSQKVFNVMTTLLYNYQVMNMLSWITLDLAVSSSSPVQTTELLPYPSGRHYLYHSQCERNVDGAIRVVTPEENQFPWITSAKYGPWVTSGCSMADTNAPSLYFDTGSVLRAMCCLGCSPSITRVHIDFHWTKGKASMEANHFDCPCSGF